MTIISQRDDILMSQQHYNGIMQYLNYLTQATKLVMNYLLWQN